MKKQLNEIKRMQQLAGIKSLNENKDWRDVLDSDLISRIEYVLDSKGWNSWDDVENEIEKIRDEFNLVDTGDLYDDPAYFKFEDIYQVYPHDIKVYFDKQYNSSEEDLDDDTWTDPAGGTHYGNEDDPAAMYK